MDMDMDLLALLLFLLIIMGISGMAATRRQSKNLEKKSEPVTYTGANAAAQTAASTAKHRATNPEQLVQDVKMTQTSRIMDAVQVLDELGEASPGYRHYCELVGTSQPTSGVIAPYSKREVAYYDLRCYRIEVRGGRDVETLVAREKSIEPFYLTDTSGTQKVYVDLESFGDHCILVNATNRVEGPKSDFSKKFSSAMGAVDSEPATGIPGVMAFARHTSQALRHALGRIADGAGACAALVLGASQAASATNASNIVLAQGRPGGMFGGPFAGGPRPGGGYGNPRPQGYGNPRPQGYNQRPPVSYGPGMSGYPPHLQVFLGGTNPAYMGGPRYRKNDDLEDAMGALIGMGLGALIGSLSSPSPASTSGYGTATNVDAINGFRGYRIIEDVVPLNSPIYALGEIYRNGTDVYIGRSVAAEYPSSYFATKPEAEVIAALS